MIFDYYKQNRARRLQQQQQNTSGSQVQHPHCTHALMHNHTGCSSADLYACAHRYYACTHWYTLQLYACMYTHMQWRCFRIHQRFSGRLQNQSTALPIVKAPSDWLPIKIACIKYTLTRHSQRWIYIWLLDGSYLQPCTSIVQVYVCFSIHKHCTTTTDAHRCST